MKNFQKPAMLAVLAAFPVLYFYARPHLYSYMNSYLKEEEFLVTKEDVTAFKKKALLEEKERESKNQNNNLKEKISSS